MFPLCFILVLSGGHSDLPHTQLVHLSWGCISKNMHANRNKIGGVHVEFNHSIHTNRHQYLVDICHGNTVLNIFAEKFLSDLT